jgi:hypothetical protein
MYPVSLNRNFKIIEKSLALKATGRAKPLKSFANWEAKTDTRYIKSRKHVGFDCPASCEKTNTTK